MPQQIIQQPDGRWCVFSTVVDAIVIYDATEQDIEDYFVEDAIESARQNVRMRIEGAKTKSRRMIPSFDEALREHEKRHGPLLPPPMSDDRKHIGERMRRWLRRRRFYRKAGRPLSAKRVAFVQSLTDSPEQQEWRANLDRPVKRATRSLSDDRQEPERH